MIGPGMSAEPGMPTATIYNWIYPAGSPPATPREQNWIITADDQQIRERRRRARLTGFYIRARWAQPQHEPDKKQTTQP